MLSQWVLLKRSSIVVKTRIVRKSDFSKGGKELQKRDPSCQSKRAKIQHDLDLDGRFPMTMDQVSL